MSGVNSDGGKDRRKGNAMTNLVSELKSTVRDYRISIQAAQDKCDDFAAKYSQIYQPDAFAKGMSELTAKRDTAIADGNAAVKHLVDGWIASIADIDTLKGAEMTDDVKLIESPVKLTQEDLAAMFDRAKAAENRTMQQLVMRRALRDGINIGRVFYTKEDYESAAHTLECYAYSGLPGGMYYDIVWSTDAGVDKIIPDALRDLFGMAKPYRYGEAR